MEYKLKKFDFKDLEQIIKDNNTIKSNYVINTSTRGAEMFRLVIEMDQNPNEKAKLRLKEIGMEIENEAEKSHSKNARDFITKYGQILYMFIESISKKHFLAYKTGDYLSWNAIGECEEDEYYQIVFDKGIFNYELHCSFGYGAERFIEKDIKKERVLQLLKK